MNPEAEVSRLIKQHGGVLVRTKRHKVWKFPDGRVFTTAATPSDYRAYANQLTDLKRTLGLTKSEATVGARREKNIKRGSRSSFVVTPSASSAMLEAMRKSALVEEVLYDRIAALTIELKNSRQANHRKKVQLRDLDTHIKKCWGCRLRRWLRRAVIACETLVLHHPFG